MAIETRNRRLGPWNSSEVIIDAINDLEDINVKALWFESINSGVSGSFSPPTGGTIVLDEWAAGVDVLVSREDSGLPTFDPVLDAEGYVITGTLDALGNWTISGIPSDGYNISLVYVYIVDLIDFNYLNSLESAQIEGPGTLRLLGKLTDDLSGFPDNYKSFSSPTFVSGTRTFSLTPTGDSFSVWVLGKEFIYSAVEEVVITDVEGSHWIYFDSDGAIQEIVNPTEDQEEDLIKKNALIAYVLWDATNGADTIFADERHGVAMPGAEHYYHHEITGFAYYEGAQAGDITSDGSGNLNASATMSITDGTFFDEDIRYKTSDSGQSLTTPAQIPVYYIDGVIGNWRKDVADDYPVKSFVGGSSLLAYNSYSAPNYGQTEITNNRYVLAHIFAVNDISEPIIAVQGRAEYLNVNAARLGAEAEVLAMDLTGLPAQEYTVLYTLIYQCSTGYSNDVQARIRTTDLGFDYIDWRNVKVAGGGSGGTGDVTGPSSATDNAIARFDGATGKVIQDSNVTIADDDTINVPGGHIIAGEEDTTFGRLWLYGDGPGSIKGGIVSMYCAADYDGVFEAYSFNVQEDDFFMGASDGTGQLICRGATGQWQFRYGSISIGITDSVAGNMSIYGDGAASTTGGSFFLYTAADHDTTIDAFGFQVYEDDLFIGPNTDVDSLKYKGANNFWQFGAGKVELGASDSIPGLLYLYGNTTGQVAGGTAYLFTSADYDTTIDYYQIQANQDDLIIGPNTNFDALKYDGGTNEWSFTDGTLNVGISDTIFGRLYLHGDATGSNSGGQFSLYTAADYDGTIDRYIFQSFQDDLYIGPSTDSDAFVYYGHANTWYFTSGSLFVGQAGVTKGDFRVLGPATGTDGGFLRVYLSGDHDTTYTFFNIYAYQENLLFSTNTASYMVLMIPGGSVNLYHNGVLKAQTIDDGFRITTGVVTIPETMTPTADANEGKVYCKNDNKLYFQDGAGAEHEVAFV